MNLALIWCSWFSVWLVFVSLLNIAHHPFWLRITEAVIVASVNTVLWKILLAQRYRRKQKPSGMK